MKFDNLRIKEIETVVRFTPSRTEFSSVGKTSHIIGIQITGSALHTFRNTSCMLSGNTLYFFNQKDDYRVNVKEKGVAFSVHFTTYEPIATDSFFAETQVADKAIRLLERIYLEFISSRNELKMLSDVYSLCSLIEAAHNKKNDPFDPRMRKAENFLTAHYKEPFCLDAAAAECNLSRRRFNDLFKTAFGQTPNRYVINRKIRYAAGLLKSSYLNVSDIAELCGFSDIYYFSRVFKTETGFSPSEYRKIGFGNDL